MHNLLLETSKHMIEVWIKIGFIGNMQVNTTEKVTSKINYPQDVGQPPLNIGFSGFTADQWRLCTTVYIFPCCFKNVLPDNHLKYGCCLYVLAPFYVQGSLIKLR